MKKSANLVLCFLICVIFILSKQSFAQDQDLTINAQNMNYSEDGLSVEAQGSVEVVYKDLQVSGDQFVYFPQEKRINTTTWFKMNYADLNFFGQNLDFNLKNKAGLAGNVTVQYKNVILSGKSIKIEPNKIVLSDADFTTCTYSHPHYHFSAGSIVLYPEDGWLICYWAALWLDGIPTMPVPIYVYDLRAEEKGTAHTLPYPQFGSNDQDGSYVLQSFPWQINRQLNGNATVGYSDKKAAGAGFDSKYTINPQNDGNITLFDYAKDPATIVLKHNYDFGPDIDGGKSFTFSLFKLPTIKQYELSTTISVNERINYERVSMIPMLNLSLKKGNFQRFDFEGGIGAGFVTEESSGKGLGRALGNLKISIPVYEGAIGKLTPGLNNEATLYGNGTHWLKMIGSLELDKIWSDNFSTGVGFNHFILNKGASPYNYENYRLVNNDQINAGFMAGFGTSKYGVNAVYNLPNMDPQDIDYILKAGIHCFSLIINYRATRREFNLGFGIN